MSDGSVFADSIVAQRCSLSVLRLLRPFTVVGGDKIRVGRIHDGGYVMLRDFRKIEAAYSLGIEKEVSWDRQIASYGIDIFQYDHTIDSLPELNDRFHWSKIGISAVPKPDENLNTLENLIIANDHSNLNMLLKCDIEGHEYDMLNATPRFLLQKFSQIVMEIHGLERLFDINHAKFIYDALSKLTADHQVIHVHANNHAPYVILGGVPVPSVMELTLVRRVDHKFSVCETTFPTELDTPCHPHAADFHLGTFSF